MKLKIQKSGLILLYLYIFFSYTAHDIILPSKLNTIFLYSLIAWGIFTIIKTLRVRISAYTKWYLFFMVYSMGIMLYSPKIEFGTSSQLYLMLVALIITYLIGTTILTETDFKGLCWCYGISSLALSGILYFTGNLVGTEDDRLGGNVVGNANIFADMMMIAVIFELWLLVYATKKKYVLKVILLLMLSINIYAMFLSGGRKFIIVPILYLYILLIMKCDAKGKRKIFRYTFMIVMIVIGLYFLMMKVPIFYNVVGYRMQFLLNSITGTGKAGESVSIRSLMKKMAIRKWKKSPLWGYGFDSFKYYNRSVTGYFMYSHCNYTELLYNGGVFYCVIYYIFYIRTLIKTWRLRKVVKIEYIAFAAAIILSMALFDYGAVTYSIANIQILLCLSSKVLDFKAKGKNM